MPASQALASELSKTILENKVVVFSKSFCPYSRGAKQLLDGMHVKHKDIELDTRSDTDEYIDALSSITGHTSVPQVFLDGQFIGGGDELDSKKQSGELQDMLRAAHISTTWSSSSQWERERER